ncbi:MAG: cell division protein SepF [Clostridia bacterium]|nr:cell division protein SepF [Clostridia bacterium]
MSFFRKAKNDPKDGYAGYYDAPAVTPVQTSQPSAVDIPDKAPGTTLNLGGNNMELKVIYPTVFGDVSEIADHLISGRTVFLNLEKTDREVSRRVMDFVSGVAYCIGGNIRRVAASTFIVSPKSVDVSETGEESAPEDPELS